MSLSCEASPSAHWKITKSCMKSKPDQVEHKFPSLSQTPSTYPPKANFSKICVTWQYSTSLKYSTTLLKGTKKIKSLLTLVQPSLFWILTNTCQTSSMTTSCSKLDKESFNHHSKLMNPMLTWLQVKLTYTWKHQRLSKPLSSQDKVVPVKLKLPNTVWKY